MLDDCILGDELSEWHSSVQCSVMKWSWSLWAVGWKLTVKFQCTLHVKEFEYKCYSKVNAKEENVVLSGVRSDAIYVDE